MYNYMEAIKNDIKNYISENVTKEYKSRDDMFKDLDSDCDLYHYATGNDREAYYGDQDEAKKAIYDNIPLLQASEKQYGCVIESLLDEDFCGCDCTIRCLLFEDALSEVLDEKFKEEIK